MPIRIENISDTALWVAYYRALESERPDALFCDPFAKLLAGSRGQEITEFMDYTKKHTWALAVRTALLDKLILETIKSKEIDTVLNLACGLDTRAYRLSLPALLKWIEV